MAESIQPPCCILRRKQVEVRTGLSRSTLYARINAETFPAPVSLGPRAVGWIESDVQRWVADRIDAGMFNRPGCSVFAPAGEAPRRRANSV